MKKYLVLVFLLLTINSFSQADSTKIWEAREVWKSNVNNWNQGQPMPNWDLNGNIIPIIGIVLISGILLKRNNKFRYTI
jgi:hypothetical protein